MLLLPVPFLLHNRIESLHAGNTLNKDIDRPRPPQPREKRHTVRPKLVDCHIRSLCQMDCRHNRNEQRLDRITEPRKGWYMPKQHPMHERPLDKITPTGKQCKRHQASGEDHGGEAGWPAVFGDSYIGEVQGSEAVVVHLDGAFPNLIER